MDGKIDPETCDAQVNSDDQFVHGFALNASKDDVEKSKDAKNEGEQDFDTGSSSNDVKMDGAEDNLSGKIELEKSKDVKVNAEEQSASTSGGQRRIPLSRSQWSAMFRDFVSVNATMSYGYFCF